jgi:hypothetical protein
MSSPSRFCSPCRDPTTFSTSHSTPRRDAYPIPTLSFPLISIIDSSLKYTPTCLNPLAITLNNCNPKAFCFYSFGVLLLDIVSGRRSIDPNIHTNCKLFTSLPIWWDSAYIESSFTVGFHSLAHEDQPLLGFQWTAAPVWCGDNPPVTESVDF